MKKLRKPLSLALALLIILSFAACGASMSKSDSATNESAPQATAEPYAYDSYADGGDAKYNESEAGGVVGTGSGTASGIPQSDKIIYSGSATVETLEFDKTLEDLDKIIQEVGGFIQSSQLNGNDYSTYAYGGASYRSAYYDIRIPSDKFAAVLGMLETLGNVPYSSSNAENITMQYHDTQARLTARRTEETRLLELMSMAKDVEEMLKIESSLSDVRYEIESLESQIKNWDSLVNYSTLSLNIQEVRLYSDEEPAALSYGKQLSMAFTNSLKDLGHFFKALFKWFVGALPVLVLLAIIAVPTALLVRRHNKKKKAKKAEPKRSDNTKE